MKTMLVLSVLLCAALAAPAEVEEKSPEMPAESNQLPAVALEEQLAPAPAEEMMGEARVNFCPNGWFTHGYKCYIFVNSPKNWFSAKVHCNRLGANLTSVSSPKEYSFLQQLTKMASQSTVWLGGYYLQGRWVWINNEGFYYTNWYYQSSSASNPCMYLRSTSGWGNTQCTSPLRFICSKTPFGC